MFSVNYKKVSKGVTKRYNLLWRTESDVEKATAVLQGYTWKNKQINVKVQFYEI